MAKAIFTVLFEVIRIVCNVVLSPINAIVVSFFPDFSSLISRFNNILNTYLGGGITYFISIIPPNTKSVIIFYIGLLIAYYSLSASLHIILKVYAIIKNIKFW